MIATRPTSAAMRGCAAHRLHLVVYWRMILRVFAHILRMIGALIVPSPSEHSKYGPLEIMPQCGRETPRYDSLRRFCGKTATQTAFASMHATRETPVPARLSSRI